MVCTTSAPLIGLLVYVLQADSRGEAADPASLPALVTAVARVVHQIVLVSWGARKLALRVETEHFLRLADAGLNVHAGRADLLFHRLLDLLDSGTSAQLLNLLRQHAGRVCQIWVLRTTRTGRLLLLLFGVL